MTMMQKINVKKAKKGFTLVELVIVVAILAILAAIAIPVVTTTINSAKLSTLKSDSSTVDMMIKEWVVAYKADMDYVVYNGKTAKEATFSDVMKANEIDMNVVSMRTFGGASYMIQWNKTDETVHLAGIDPTLAGKTYVALSSSTKVTSLCRR